MFEIVFFVLMLAFAALAYYGGYRQGRLDTKIDTPSASYNTAMAKLLERWLQCRTVNDTMDLTHDTKVLFDL